MALPTATSSSATSPVGSTSRTEAGNKRVANALLQWIDHPSRLTLVAMLIGWGAMYFAYRDHWLGLVLALACTVAGFVAMERGRSKARGRSHRLRAAIDAAAARNRELDLLRGLGATLLRVRSSGELLEEAASRANHLLNCQSSLILLMAEEGRFLRIGAAAGRLRSAVGGLVPVERSLVGWSVGTDRPVVSQDMAKDPRNFPVQAIPSDLTRMITVPLRSSGVVIGVVTCLNRQEDPGFGDHDVALLTALAEQVAVGLDRAFMIEETRRSEQALADKNRELVRATKLKDEFLANMSHEFRTPLNAIIGFSELILASQSEWMNEEQRDFIESIARNGRHLLGLINNILDLSKIEAGRMTVNLTRADFRASLRAAVTDTASIRLNKRQTCTIEEADQPIDLLADHVRVRQILINLLSNASKFTLEGGSIHVSAVRTSVPLPMPASRNGESARLVTRDAVWISVRDTGTGIKSEDMDKLFKVFSQVDSSSSRQQQGTGLGLALCKQFVEMHGGTIGVESVYGEGSTFWFVLPLEGPIRHPQ